MADRQYLPLAEPFELPVAVTPLPQSLLPLPLPKPRLRLEGLAGPSPIARPYDLPITPPPDVVRAKVPAPQWDRTYVPVTLPYDRPLLDSSPLVIRRPLRALGEASSFYGQADAVLVPDLAQAFGDVPTRRPFFLRDTRTPSIGQADPVVVPDLSQAFGDMPVRRALDLRHTQSPEFGRDDPAGVPDLSTTLYELPLRRRPFLIETRSSEFGRSGEVGAFALLPDPVRRARQAQHTQSLEYGRSDPPPPAAPDLSALIPADPPRRKRLEIGTVTAQTVLPPGYAPDWYPSAEYPIVRRRFLTAEAYARPDERPIIPFDPQQQVATLPQPPLRPRATQGYAARATVPPVGPPSSALTPPGVTSWNGLPNQPPATAAPRQGLFPAPQNLVPIPQNAPPELSWQPSAEVPPARPSRRPWLEAFAQNIDPLNTPAYLASFWISYYPPGPFPKQGLLASLQQVFADAPPAVELQVVFGAWRPEVPALLLRAARLTPEAYTRPQDYASLADVYGCISLNSVRVTQPTLLAAAVTGPTLLDVEVTSSTLLIDEVC